MTNPASECWQICRKISRAGWWWCALDGLANCKIRYICDAHERNICR